MILQALENKELKNQLAFAAITAASFLVLLYGSVFKGIPMGINVLLFIGVCYGCMFAFLKAFRAVIRESAFHTVVVVLLGITFLLYNNLILLTINGFLIIMIVGVQYRFLLRKQRDPLYSLQIIGDACVVWFGYSFAGLPGAFGSIGKNKKASGIKGAIIGIAITIPVLAAVIALLMSADFAFSDMFKNTFKNLDAGDVVGYSIVGVLLFACASGLFYSLKTRNPKGMLPQKKLLDFNKIAISLMVGCIDVVLAVFGVLQFAYLFTGNVPAGYSYAQYAQNGFWQLVGVAVIVAAIVFIVQKTSQVRTEKSIGIKILLTALCALTEILLVSAFWRMVLYEQAFYFSILRIFTQAFMVAAAGVFLTLISSLWKPDFKLKKWVFIVSTVVYLGLNFMNADAFISQQNCVIQNDSADIGYMSQLSVDALPYYADKIDAKINAKTDDAFDPQYYMFCRGLVSIREGVAKADGWQYYNVSRENAKAYVEQYKRDFDSAQNYIEQARSDYD